MADLSPPLFQQFFDSNGDPLAGGKVHTYVAGSSTPSATYTDRSGSTPNTNPILLDANGTADIWIGPGYFKFVITDADDVVLKTIDNVSLAGSTAESIPSGGLTGQVLKKKTDADFDTEWADAESGVSYHGYSERYNQLVDLDGVEETLDFIMDMGYSPPSVSFTASGSGTLREKGNAVTAVDLDLSFTKVSEDVEEVRFYYDGGLVHTDNTLNPAADSVSYAWTGSFSDNKTFQAQVDDATNSPAVTINRTFNFVYPYYFGVGAAGLGAGVSALTKDIINSNANLAKTFSPNGSQKMYFAYPASYGALTAIYDVNNFNTLPDWTLTTTNITGLDGNPVSYRIYEFNNFAVAGTYSYNFVR